MTCKVTMCHWRQPLRSGDRFADSFADFLLTLDSTALVWRCANACATHSLGVR
jgi:hypothetical protein